jgi:hypothetical protein
VCTVEARQRAAGDTGSGPGTVVSLRRAVRPLEHARVQGWADIRVRRALHANLSLARPQDRDECATSGAGSEGSFKSENEVFLPMLDRAREPSNLEQAPGNGRFRRRPRLSANGFALNTNRRGGEQWPGGTCRPRLLDGAMDQLHKRSTTD